MGQQRQCFDRLSTSLLNDGVNTYAYDSANRLTSISGGQTATYAYNGLGDRLSQNGAKYKPPPMIKEAASAEMVVTQQWTVR